MIIDDHVGGGGGGFDDGGDDDDDDNKVILRWGGQCYVYVAAGGEYSNASQARITPRKVNK